MVSNNKPEVLMEQQEVADTLRISIRTLHNRFRTGKLRYVKDGRRVLVDPADLRKYIESQKVGNGVSN